MSMRIGSVANGIGRTPHPETAPGEGEDDARVVPTLAGWLIHGWESPYG